MKISVVKANADKKAELKFSFEISRKIDVDLPIVKGIVSVAGGTCFDHSKAVINFDSKSSRYLKFTEPIETMVDATEEGHVLFVHRSTLKIVKEGKLDSSSFETTAKALITVKDDIANLITCRPNKYFLVVPNKFDPALVVVTSLDYAIQFCTAVQQGYRAGKIFCLLKLSSMYIQYSR